jgi:hypothetical protein
VSTGFNDLLLPGLKAPANPLAYSPSQAATRDSRQRSIPWLAPLVEGGIYRQVAD